jgi:phage tail sheath protein FI
VTLPGPVITTGTSRPNRSFPTQTDTFFLTGEFEKGPAGTAIEVRSMAQVADRLGDRLAANPLAYDALELFFAEGGARALVSREVGPAAVRATVVLDDSGGVDTMRVTAKGEGSYGNLLNVAIAAGDVAGTFVIAVTHDTLGALETSPALADVTEATIWAENVAEHVDIADIGTSSLDPAVVAATSLTGGTDDRGNILQAHVTLALTAFTQDLGPGQVASPGRTAEAAHAAVIAHAASYNRVPLLDAPNDANVATVTGRADAARSVTGSNRARMVWPWVQIRGLTATTRRTVPPSALQAAFDARNDNQSVSPNQGAAGEFGRVQSSLVLGLSQPAASDADREALADKGVTIIRRISDQSIRTYDITTLANRLTDPEYRQIGTARLLMRLKAECEPPAESFQFREITPGNLLALAAGVENVIKRYAPDSIFGYQVQARDIDECRAAEEFRVDALIEVTEGARTVSITITKEGAA